MGLGLLNGQGVSQRLPGPFERWHEAIGRLSRAQSLVYERLGRCWLIEYDAAVEETTPENLPTNRGVLILLVRC